MTDKTTSALKLAEQEKQEPVAYRSRWKNTNGQVITGWVLHDNKPETPEARQETEPLYAAPVSAPEQEPVAWMYERENSITNVHLEQIEDAVDRGWKETPLYFDPSYVRVVVVPAYDGSNVEARAKRGTK